MEENTRVNDIIGEINGLKQLLTMSDYKALKYSDGALSDVEYAPIRTYRESLRAKINQLEAELESLNETF